MSADDFIEAYGKASDSHLIDRGGAPRSHLGASQVGHRCARKSWYDFRWCSLEQPEPRMRRLWARGHAEEFNFVRYLRGMGIEVWDYAERLVRTSQQDGVPFYISQPWEQPLAYDEEDVSASEHHIAIATKEEGVKLRQWSFGVDIGEEPVPVFDKFGLPACGRKGHFSGSNDGVLPYAEQVMRFFPEVGLLTGRGGCEFKTSNHKNFMLLKANGVQKAKAIHYVQMQVYMHFLGLGWCLYLAVDKDTDHIYPEVVIYRPEVAQMYANRGMQIVANPEAPPKMTSDPSFFECKFCPHSEQCHHGKDPTLKNCRSCAFAQPIEGVRWRCNLHQMRMPEGYDMTPCDQWEAVK